MSAVKQLMLKETNLVYVLSKSALLFFFLADGCNKFLYLLHSDFYRVSILFRSIYEVLFLGLILLFINEVRLLFLKIFLLLFALFLTGQIFLSFNVYYEYNLKENISLFNKYFFVFVIFFAIYKLQNFPDKFKNVVKLMENIFLFNSIITILGFIFHITLLRTYTDSDKIYRYGYSGFIPAQNEATLFFFISLCYFYYQRFFCNIKSIKFFLVLLSCFLLGTKGIYLFLAFLLIFHFFYFSSLKSKFITLLIIITVLIGGYFYLQTEHSRILLEYFISRKDKNGWLTMILSGRNSFISTKGSDVFSNWNIFNYFIGGQDQTKLYMEMDFIDLFFFMGIIGSVIYFALYFTTLFRFNVLKPFNFFFLFSFLTLAFFGGHFFASAVNSLYLCLVLMYFHASQNNVFDNLLKKG